jgi:regulator of PEP synthase PpsR (kinase-PPPase family)
VSDEQDDESGDDQDENSDDENSEDDSDEHSNIVSATASKFLLNADDDHPQYSKQARIDAILEAAAASKDKKGNPVLRSATAALEETAQTITRMRTERNDASPRDKK